MKYWNLKEHMTINKNELERKICEDDHWDERF